MASNSTQEKGSPGAYGARKKITSTSWRNYSHFDPRGGGGSERGDRELKVYAKEVSSDSVQIEIGLVPIEQFQGPTAGGRVKEGDAIE